MGADSVLLLTCVITSLLQLSAFYSMHVPDELPVELNLGQYLKIATEASDFKGVRPFRRHSCRLSSSFYKTAASPSVSPHLQRYLMVQVAHSRHVQLPIISVQASAESASEHENWNTCAYVSMFHGAACSPYIRLPKTCSHLSRYVGLIR